MAKRRAMDEESCRASPRETQGHESDEGKEGIDVNASVDDQWSVQFLTAIFQHVLAL